MLSISSCADNWLRAVHVLVVVSEVLLLHVPVAVDDNWLRAVHVLVVVSEVLLLYVPVAVDDGLALG